MTKEQRIAATCDQIRETCNAILAAWPAPKPAPALPRLPADMLAEIAALAGLATAYLGDDK